MVRVVRLISDIGIPEDAIIVQLYFDYKSRDWRYLLAPTLKGFGHFIDRVIDIKTGACIGFTSAEQFIEFAGVTPKDGFKFLVDPFWYNVHKTSKKNM